MDDYVEQTDGKRQDISKAHAIKTYHGALISWSLGQAGEHARAKRTKISNLAGLPNGGRRYWFDVQGRQGWMARYVKEVDASEMTVRFYQEIYDETGKLVEVYHKYPIDQGHKKVTP